MERLVDGSQEDLDLLVCWTTDQGTLLVAVEAKAYGSWGNTQMFQGEAARRPSRRLRPRDPVSGLDEPPPTPASQVRGLARLGSE